MLLLNNPSHSNYSAALSRAFKQQGLHSPNSKGVAMVEMALVIPFLLFLTLGALDICRYYWIKHTLEHAAAEGIVAARTEAGLYLDITGKLPGSPEYDAYYQAIKNINAKALAYAMKTAIAPPGSTAPVYFLPYNYPTLNFSGEPTWVGAVAIVRPYECISRTSASSPIGCTESDSFCLRHPALPKGYPCKQSIVNPERQMLTQPIMVELQANMKLITPLAGLAFGGPLTVRGSALGYRENVPKTSLTLNPANVTTTTTTVTWPSTTTTVPLGVVGTTTTTLCKRDWVKCGLLSIPIINESKKISGKIYCKCQNKKLDKEL